MFNIGDTVVYGINGVFVIEDIRKERVLGENHNYYVLKEICGKRDSLLYVPTDNEALISTLRYPISYDDATRLIEEIESVPEAEWQKDSRGRINHFKSIISEGDHRGIISVIKSIWKNGERRRAEGKKSYLMDETTLQKAERILYSELSIALGIPEDEVLSHILNTLQAKISPKK